MRTWYLQRIKNKKKQVEVQSLVNKILKDKN
jgi:hypothetical protein